MSLTLAELPMGFGWNYGALNVKRLQKLGKLFTTKLPRTVGHQLLWRSSPAKPVCLHLTCYFLGRSGFAGEGYLEIGAGIDHVVKRIAYPLG